MKTSRLILITATIVALAAPTASARPVSDPAPTHAAQPTAATGASIAAHHEQISDEQWQRSQTASPAAPLTDRTTNDGRFPLVFVLVGLTVPLALALAAFAAKPVLAYSRRHRAPTHVA
jgi:hypothetical protein